MANPYGIALSRAWTEWAAKQGVSETIAAALYLLSENRKAGEVVGRLTPGELGRVIDVVGHQLDCFPPGTLAALEDCRPTSPKASARSGPPGTGRNPYGITLSDKDLRWAAAEGVPESVIAAIYLLHDERGVDEIVARLTTRELEQVINIAGRSPQSPERMRAPGPKALAQGAPRRACALISERAYV